MHSRRRLYVSWPRTRSWICAACNCGDEHNACSPVSLRNATSRNRPRDKINYVIIHLACAASSCVFVCFAACLCSTRELHPVLIKAGCSFYIITECDACLQQISPIISVCYTRHPAPGTLATLAFLPIALLPCCNLLHLFLLLPFHPHSHLQFPHPLTPSFTPSDVLIPVPLISAVLHDFLIKCFCFLLFLNVLFLKVPCGAKFTLPMLQTIMCVSLACPPFTSFTCPTFLKVCAKTFSSLDVSPLWHHKGYWYPSPPFAWGYKLRTKYMLFSGYL